MQHENTTGKKALAGPKNRIFPENGKMSANELSPGSKLQNIFRDSEAALSGNGESKPPTLEDFEHIRITAEKDIPHHPPVITIGGQGVAARRNITVPSGPSKSGKSAIVNIMVAGAISQTGKIDGLSDMEVEANPDRKAVIVANTEEAEDDHQYGVKTSLRRVGMDHTPDYLLSYNFRQLNKKNYRPTLDPICEAASSRFNGIHMIFIDGGADFCESINDDKEAAEVVEYFTHLAIKYDCPVIIVVHVNPGTEKERGHFGSELQRKCYGLLGVTSKDGVSTLSVKIGRKANTADTPLIYFRYDQTKGYHTECAEPDGDTAKAEKERDRHQRIADKVFSGQKSYTYTEAVQVIMKSTSRKERTVKNMVRDMEGWGFITKGDDKRYRLCSK